MPVVDLSGVELMNFDALPAGEYRVAVDRAEVRQSNSSGEDNVLWVLKVTDVHKLRGDTDGAGLIGRTIVHGTSLQPKALWNLFRTLVALGENPEDIQRTLDVNDEYLSDFVGRECVVTLRQREYQGQMTNQVVQIRALKEEEAMALR